jgi:hypothetical protein
MAVVTLLALRVGFGAPKAMAQEVSTIIYSLAMFNRVVKTEIKRGTIYMLFNSSLKLYQLFVRAPRS